MSDFYSMSRNDRVNIVEVYTTDDIGGASIDRAIAMLAGIPHAADKAVGSAIKRAGQTGLTYASRVIRTEYHVKDSDFQKYTRRKRHIYTHGGETTVEIDFKGWHIPLMSFDVSVGKDGRVKARVKRSGTKTTFDNAFIGKAGSSGHTGVFERKTEKRLPILEILGPSTPQMMDYNDDVSIAIGDKVRETFEERLDHEITAILNGWRIEKSAK